LREKQEADEHECQRIAKEAADKAAQLAADSAVPVMDLEDDEPLAPTATEQRLAELEKAPAVVASKPAGVNFRVMLVATVTDIEKLAPEFVVKTANMGAIRARYCVGFKDGDALPEVAGVKFEVSRAPVSNGRPVF
jgi:hypothetical protein